MIPRAAAPVLLKLAGNHPLVVVSGPCRSGKGTLCRSLFPDKPCVSLEEPDMCEFASVSPADFLEGYPGGAILLEAQRSPALLDHLLKRVVNGEAKGLFILTGPLPLDFLSVVGAPDERRFGLLRLLPFSMAELTGAAMLPEKVDDLLFRGMYPPIYAADSSPSVWYAGYVSSFMDREVRRIVNIRDLALFQRFLRACAAATARRVNLSALADDSGITHNTARAWLTILETSNLVYLIQPHLKSYGKRLVKTPKLYFCDTGLAAWLMGIREVSHLAAHPLRGALFETWVMGELVKGRYNRGLPADFRFWRDNIGNEIAIVATQGETLLPIDISPEEELRDDMFAGLRWWLAIAGSDAGRGRLIFAGNERQRRDEAAAIPWKELDSLAERL